MVRLTKNEVQIMKEEIAQALDPCREAGLDLEMMQDWPKDVIRKFLNFKNDDGMDLSREQFSSLRDALSSFGHEADSMNRDDLRSGLDTAREQVMATYEQAVSREEG